jgi:hypothetical protein
MALTSIADPRYVMSGRPVYVHRKGLASRRLK